MNENANSTVAPNLFDVGAVASEVAEKEFIRFADYLDAKSDTSKMNGDDAESFDQIKNRVMDEIIDEQATVDQEGKLTYTLKHPGGAVTELTFNRPKGTAYLEMDRFKERQSMNKIFGFAGSMTGQPPKFLSNLDGADAKFVLSICNLFLGS